MAARIGVMRVNHDGTIDYQGHHYVRERTCEAEANGPDGRPRKNGACSVCGKAFQARGQRYCSGCGARVGGVA